MRHFPIALFLSLALAACGGGIDSYEDAMEAQMDVMEDMLDVLADVHDADSAKDAEPEIEALGKRLVELGEELQDLPEPTPEDMQALAEKYTDRTQEFQSEMMTQMMKMAEYPELSEAFSRAMSNAK